MSQVRQMAEDFELPTDGGGHFKLSAARGRPVVVVFYPKDGTEGCTREAKDFSDRAAAFAKAGASVVGISEGSVAAKDKFRAKHDLAIRLAADTDLTVARAFGVYVQKSMYGHTFMGIERSTFLIDADGRIAEAWRKVRVPGHAETVLAAVLALTSGSAGAGTATAPAAAASSKSRRTKTK